MKANLGSTRVEVGAWTTLSVCVAVCLTMLTGAAVSTQAAEETKEADSTKEAAKDTPKTEAGAKETGQTEAKKEPEKKALTPEQYFEGGEKTYNNWVEFGVGGMFTSGSKAQAEQSRRLSRGAFGGIEDLHYQDEVATNVNLTVDGRALFDQNDYKLTVGLTRPEKWFLKFHYEEFRTWYNANGGYFPPSDAWYPHGDDALELDRGEISFEGGLTLKNWPALTFKYAHAYREGEKSSTSWGYAHPPGDTAVRALSPSFYDIDEYRDVFQLDLSQRIKTTDVGVGLRYESGKLDNALKINQWPGESFEQKITDQQKTSYDLFNVHAFTETWIKQNLFFSSGFSYSDLDNDFSGSRIYGSDFDVGYAPGGQNGFGYYGLNGGSRLHEYLLDLNLMAIPASHFTITPSIRVQKKDADASFSGFETLGSYAPAPFNGSSDREVLDVRERLDLSYNGITNWVLYARGEWTEGEGNLKEDGGMIPINDIGIAPIKRDTDDSRFFQKYSIGARWYPTRKITADFGGYYKLNRYDYDHDSDSTPNGSVNRYPAYLVVQDFETYDGNVRLSFRPRPNVTLVSRYEYQISTVNTRPDGDSGLGRVESSEMTSHIIAQNVSWTPWSRLYLQAGFNYVLSKTETPASDYTEAVLDAENNYWMLNFNAGLVLDNKTDLNVGYTYYRADNYDDNSTEGVPYGVGAEDHGVTATIVHRLSERMRLTVRYGYYHSEDETSGWNNDYEAHVVSSSLQYRF